MKEGKGAVGRTWQRRRPLGKKGGSKSVSHNKKQKEEKQSGEERKRKEIMTRTSGGEKGIPQRGTRGKL